MTKIEKKQKTIDLFESLSNNILIRKFIDAIVTIEYVLETLSISRRLLYDVLRKMGYNNKTHMYSKKIGFVARDDMFFWSSLHKQYFEGTSNLAILGKQIGFDWLTLIRKFRAMGFKDPERNVVKKFAMKQRRKTNKNKYGVEIYFSANECREKIKKTCIKRYGVDAYQKTQQFKDFQSDTCSFNLKEVQDKINEHNKEIYEKRKKEWLASLNFELLEDHGPLKIGKQRVFFKLRHLECNTEFIDDLIKQPKCPKCHIIGGSSVDERLLLKYIRSICTYKVIAGSKRHISSKLFSNVHYQIDIWIPEINIGFEYNGIYFHSLPMQQDIERHYYKTKEALKHGIKLYHVWSFEDFEEIKKRVKSIIEGQKINIFVDEGNLIKVDRDWCPTVQDSVFFNTNEFLGYCKPVPQISGKFTYYNSGSLIFLKK